VDRKHRPFLLRILLAAVGLAVLLTGIVGLVLPVIPGWVLIFAGLAILAGEFVWARRLLDASKERLEKLKPSGKGRAAA
jgi:uncharacterized protein (TIGR02611 family)